MTRVTEAEMASAVRDALKRRPNRSATFAELREIIPDHINLSRADRAESESRPGEEVWMQILRNIIAHKREGFVGIAGGIKLEWRGKPNRSRGGHTAMHAHAA